MIEKDLSQLKVAIVHYWLTSMRGGEKVIEALCGLFPQADIYTNVVRPEVLSEALRKQTIRTTFIQKLPWSGKHYQKYLPLMPLALEQLDLRDYDLVISSESGPAKGVITRSDTLHICYCHSPMRYLWDFYQDYLESAGPATRLLMRPLFHRLRLWDYASAQRVDHFIANSATVERRINRWWRREAQVIHPPVDVDRFASPDLEKLRELPGSPQPGTYYLCFGALVNYKRVDLAVQACSKTGRRLIVAGTGEMKKHLEALAGPSVSIIGPVEQRLLPALYGGCKALLFPGEEDFGITPVEAMSAGRPVIAYAKGGALETVTEQTGLFFREQTGDALLCALDVFESRPSESWQNEALLRQAALFCGERFRMQIRDFITTRLENTN